MAWFLNQALTNFRAAVNARYPHRDKSSDGTIGDEDHQSRDSDHNPDPDGSVDAWDMDVDLRVPDAAAEIERLKRIFEEHPSSRYWIHNDRISSRGTGWQPISYEYAGPDRNRHRQHVHWNTRESHEDSTAPWALEDDVTPAEFLEILQNPQVASAMRAFAWQYRDPNQPSTWGIMVGANSELRRGLREIQANLARSEAEQDAANAVTLAAISALAENGGPDAAPVIDAINAARDQLKADYATQIEPLRAELTEARTEIASLRARLAAAARAEAEELDNPSG